MCVCVRVGGPACRFNRKSAGILMKVLPGILGISAIGYSRNSGSLFGVEGGVPYRAAMRHSSFRVTLL